jgi:malate synthase
VDLTGRPVPGLERVLTLEAVAFLADLERRFRAERVVLLRRRAARHAEIAAGRLVSLKVGRRRLVSDSAIAAYIAAAGGSRP